MRSKMKLSYFTGNLLTTSLDVLTKSPQNIIQYGFRHKTVLNNIMND